MFGDKVMIQNSRMEDPGRKKENVTEISSNADKNTTLFFLRNIRH